MSPRRSLIVPLIILTALTLVQWEPVMGQAASKQSSRKSRSSQKARSDKEKQPLSVSDLKKAQAQKLAEAAASEKKFNKKAEEEKATFATIRSLERQINVRRLSIKKLQGQEELLTSDIRNARSSIGDMEQQLQSLKEQYARYVRSVYKNGRVYDLELLFSSRSVNQLSIRIEYLRRFSEQRAKDLKSVVVQKSDLEHQNQRLEANLQHQQRVLSQKTSEEQSLNTDMTQHRKMLTTIREDKNRFKAQAAESRAAAAEITNLISDLIKKETEKREREAAAAHDRERAGGVPRPTASPDAVATGVFASLRGRLPWPVSVGTIAARFGKQVHPVLKTERENTGIDIRVQRGSRVLAVADGRVSIVTFIPGLGNVIILTHSDGYRSIYAQLSEADVVENEAVKAGKTIAKSGDSIDGEILHFEIWKEREKQNPELWLAKQR